MAPFKGEKGGRVKGFCEAGSGARRKSVARFAPGFGLGRPFRLEFRRVWWIGRVQRLQLQPAGKIRQFLGILCSIVLKKSVATPTDLEALASRIRNAINCGRDLALDYASAIGENPEIQNGQVLVRNEDGRIIVRVPQGVLEAGKAAN
jgi:hypothetical protein